MSLKVMPDKTRTSRTKKQSSAFWSVFKLRSGPFYDYNLLAVVIILTCFGLVMLYSASAYEATRTFGDDMHYFKRQLLISAFGIFLALVISKIDYHFILRFSVMIYGISIVLMAAVRFTPFGVEINGARRWLGYGTWTFQPSEIAKIAVILIVVYMIKRLGRDYKSFQGTVLVGALGVVAAGAAYIFTENLSTAIIILGISIGILFVSHPKTSYFVIGFIVAVAAVAGLLFYIITNIESSESFRVTRVLTWIDPEKYSELGGWQVLQGLYAIGSGGIFGKGLGNSTQKLDIIPEAGNDMIFSIICEELGLFGALLVIILFGYLLYRLVVIAQNAPDKQGALIATGIFVHISLQVVLNICVVLNVIPTTGITLPFISYGGTSVVFLMIEMGIALSISAKIHVNDEKTVIIDARTRKNITRERRRQERTGSGAI